MRTRKKRRGTGKKEKESFSPCRMGGCHTEGEVPGLCHGTVGEQPPCVDGARRQHPCVMQADVPPASGLVAGKSSPSFVIRDE